MKKTTKKEAIKTTVADIMKMDAAISSIGEQIPFSLSLRFAALLDSIEHITKAFRDEVLMLKDKHKSKKGAVDESLLNAEINVASEVGVEFEFAKLSVDEFVDREGKELNVDKIFAYHLRQVIKTE